MTRGFRLRDALRQSAGHKFAAFRDTLEREG
jgi:hypothetical protein